MKMVLSGQRNSQDFAISAIRFGEDGASIEKVRAHVYRKGRLGEARAIDKWMVVGLLLGGNRVITMKRDPENGWSPGEKVHKVYENDRIFLMTNPAEKAGDNLGSLPEF